VEQTESRLPDTLLESSGFAAIALADIDEDPTTPDAAWANASSNDVDTTVRVGFPTPSGSLTGRQSFRAFVRKNAVSGSGTPAARIDLYENGGRLATGTETPIASAGGMILTETFD